MASRQRRWGSGTVTEREAACVASGSTAPARWAQSQRGRRSSWRQERLLRVATAAALFVRVVAEDDYVPVAFAAASEKFLASSDNSSKASMRSLQTATFETIAPTPAPIPKVTNLLGEWILQRYQGPISTLGVFTTPGPYTADDCYNPYTGVGAQQMWKSVPGSVKHCFRITSEQGLLAQCQGMCTVRVFCARGGNSGVKMQFHNGENCRADATQTIDFMPHLTWPETHALLQGTCYRKTSDVLEKFMTPWQVGNNDTDHFPNCYGYDFSTSGAGVITADPKDSPYMLKLYSDSTCSTNYVPGNAAANASNQPNWVQQRWMSVFRKTPIDDRTEDMKSCWHIEDGAPPVAFFGSLKLVCQQQLDGRQGMYVKHYQSLDCSGAVYQTEIFYLKIKYELMSSGVHSVIEPTELFQGQCEEFGGDPKVYWKFDRPVHGEDWPNCYQQALTDGIRILRSDSISIDYMGDISTVRKPTGNAMRGAANFVPTAMLMIFVVSCPRFTSA